MPKALNNGERHTFGLEFLMLNRAIKEIIIGDCAVS
jgi:hypothetical protein